MHAIPDKFLDRNAVLIGYRGSIAHGMYIEPADNNNSICDIDLMGICVYPLNYYLGLPSHQQVRNEAGVNFSTKGTTTIMEGDWDIVYYELRKMMKLLAEGNPNVLPLLFMDADMYIKVTDIAADLLLNRSLFVGKHVYPKFIGFAKSERYKMRNSACQGHLGEKRRRLVDQFGYDPKNAAHSVRLLRMLIEFLETGFLNVQREDAEELLDIRNGRWTLAKIDRELDRLAAAAEAAYNASILPENIPLDPISDLCQKMLMKHHKLNQ